jgi:phospholipase/carboxylesterase
MLHSVFLSAVRRESKSLMVVLHGLGDSLEGYRWLPGALNLPWMNYLLVNAPDPYYDGYSWFDFYRDPKPGIERSRAAISELLAAQVAAGFPAEQTVLFGFSQGCLMILEVGTRYPRRFAGLIGISGFIVDLKAMLDNLDPMAKQQRYLITHGTLDPLLPFTQVKNQILHLQSAGLPITWQEFDKEHTIAGEAELAVIRQFVQAGFPVRDAVD